jgi:hypothetical protein
MAFTEQRRRALGGVAIVVACLTIVAYQGCWRKETPTNTAPSSPIGIAPPPLFDPAEPPSFGSPPSSPTTPALTEADQQIAKLENRRETLIPLLDKAEDEKAELVKKLREAGVAKLSDLKNNPTAKRYAVALQKISHDIAGIQAEIGRLDEAITHAKALKRRAEQEKVRITDEELAVLTVGSGQDLPLTASDPANLDALLAKELSESPSPTASRKSLVGKWKIEQGEVDGTVEFSAGGTVIFTWFHVGLKKDWVHTGKYSVSRSTLKITEAGDYGSQSEREIEFLSNDELLVAKQSGLGFTWLFGRLKRIP